MPRYPKITATNSGKYAAEVCISGIRYSVTENTEAKVRKKIDSLRRSPPKRSQKHENATESLSLRKAMEVYIESRTNVLSPSTIRGYEEIKRLRFKAIMDRELSPEINWQQIINDEALLCSAKTLKNAWGFAKSVIRASGFDVKNVSLPQVIPEEHEFYEPGEIKAFLEAIKGTKHEIVYLLGLHSLRASEVMGFSVKESLKNNAIYVSGACVQDKDNRYVHKIENKNYTSRRKIPILISRLRQLAQDIGVDEAQKQIPKTYSGIARPLIKICEENNLKYTTMHGLRHTFASLCYSLQIPEEDTMRFGGWADPNVMRRIYTHLAEKDRNDSVSKLRKFFN